ncbi:metal ABC transporter substrate-binding protein [Agromyces atrinae]|uniref:Zinc ABC transporter substrate-binding protein n=1 Tax=Agromyces atrinae TaxID=592376 RepID=A0A4Q2M7J9_9MICO|nr:metal ABC transporter substrate-binding protein [Agromyces atrinae]NYD67872.1 zinc/manganese transport system substrate-binding protein/manganese/iron transport system substrate-binding protein [Agromyces atrinae]RXZ87958.1 zinc ABC transporter substrate-binding protein [Agromyces atrinae]
MKTRMFVVPAALAVSALVLAGCAGTDAAATGDGTPSIVVTTTQLGDFTRELVGDDAEVTQLIQPNQSAHSFDPSAAQLLAIGNADVLVINGAGLEEWIDDAVSSSGFDGTLIDASEGIDLEGEHTHDDHAEGDDHAHEGEEHADEHATEGSDQGGEADDTTTEVKDAADDHDHEHASGDPHIWTDPHHAEQMVENVAHGLEEALPDLADTVKANETAYLAKLESLDTWIHDNIETVPAAERLLVSNHDAFTYFVDAYDITFVGSVIPSFDDNAEPSAADIDALVAAIRETGAKAIFSEASLSPKAAETIASEAGITVYSGDDALYADSLGPEGSDGATYLSATEHNVRLLLESWGVTPTELPADLRE